MSKKANKQREWEEEDEGEEPSPPPPRKRRRWKWKLAVVVLALGAFVWFLPTIVARTPLRQRIVSMAVPQLRGNVLIGSASLGWLSPVELRDITLCDAAGARILAVPSATTSRPLWQLALQSKNLGTIKIDRPELNLVLRRGGSNLEDTIKPLIDAPSQGGGGTPPSVVLEISDGRVTLAEGLEHDSRASNPQASGGRKPPVLPALQDNGGLTPPARLEERARQEIASRAITAGSLDKLNLKLTLQPGQVEPMTAVLDCIVTPAGAAAGKPLHGDMALKPGADPAKLSTDAGVASLKLTGIELSALAPLVVRCNLPLQLTGAATSDLKLDWSSDSHGPKIAVKGSAGVERLALSSADLLGQETLRLESARVSPQFSYGAGRIELQPTRAECDLGFLEASGTLDTAQWSQPQDAQQSLAKLADTNFQLQAEVDCATLAQRLPGLVRLKAETRIDSGRLTAALRSRDIEGKRRLEGSLKAANIVATSGGRRIDYPQPIQIDGDLEAMPAGAWQARVHCKSDYLTLDAEGSLGAVTMSLDADLDRLTTDVGRIVDLGKVRAAGRVTAGFQARKATNRQASGGRKPPVDSTSQAVLADGHIQLENFQLQAPDIRPWQEMRLTAALKLRGAMEGTSIVGLDEAELRVDSGADHLLAKLAKPLDKPTLDAAFPISASMEGDVAAWLARVQTWLPLEGWQLAGAARCTAEATVSKNNCDVQQARLQLQGFKAASPTLVIDEPRVELEAALQWDGAAQRIAVPTMTLATSSISMRADQILWQLDPKQRRAGGQVALRADLARLSRWLEVPGKQPPIRLGGTMLGRVELSESGGALKAQATAEADDFVAYTPATAPVRTAGPAALPATASNPWQPVWSEPKIGISGGASYQASADRLDLDQFAIDSNVLRLANLRGGIQELSGRKLVQLSGEVHYDLAKITPLLAPYTGQGVRLVGQGHRAFALNGPLTSPGVTTAVVPPELQGNAGIGFDRAEIYGLTTGAGELKADLNRQVAQFAPLKLTIGRGSLSAAPRIELMSSPLLVQEPGRVVEQLEITPALCQAWLKYVAPMLADATRVEGKFSLDLSQCRVPLADTNKSDVAGTLALHSASVRPGPVALPIVGIARQIEAVVQKKPIDAVGGLLGGGAGGGLGSGSDVQLNIQSQDIKFAVRNGRVTHSPLKFVVGNVEVRTHGSVGFDQSLDLIADVPILPQWVDKQPALRGLSGQTIQIPIRGSLSKPTLDSRAIDSLTRQVGTAAVGGVLEGALQKGFDGLLKPKK